MLGRCIQVEGIEKGQDADGLCVGQKVAEEKGDDVAYGVLRALDVCVGWLKAQDI